MITLIYRIGLMNQARTEFKTEAELQAFIKDNSVRVIEIIREGAAAMNRIFG